MPPPLAFGAILARVVVVVLSVVRSLPAFPIVGKKSKVGFLSIPIIAMDLTVVGVRDLCAAQAGGIRWDLEIGLPSDAKGYILLHGH